MLLTDVNHCIELSISEFEKLSPTTKTFLFNEKLLPSNVLEYLYSYNDLTDEDDLFWDYDYDDGF